MKALKQEVLVVGPTPPPYNGMSVVTENILKYMPQDHFKLIHLDTADRRGLANVGRLDFINIYLALKHFLQFVWMLIKERPTVVYIPISQAILPYLRDCLFLIPGKLFRRKMIIHLHGGDFKDFFQQTSPLMRLLIKWSLKNISRAMVLAKCFRGIFQDIISSDRVRIVQNGVEDTLNKGFQASEPADDNKLRVLFLSALVEEKGFLDIIRSIPLIISRTKNVEFLFAGDSSHEYEMKEANKFSIEHNVSSFIKFCGEVSGKAKENTFHIADIFIFPSWREGQPLVLLEAMAAGLPIITTDTGAIRETVADGENAFIIEKRNPQAIAEKVLLLWQDPELRRRMGQASRQSYLQYFTVDKFIKGLEEVFREVLEA